MPKVMKSVLLEAYQAKWWDEQTREGKLPPFSVWVREQVDKLMKRKGFSRPKGGW